MTVLPPARRPASPPEPHAGRVFLGDLARHGDAPALRVDGASISYRELDDRITAEVEVLGRSGRRRLVLLEAANELEAVVAYLACLRGRHPVLLVPSSASATARVRALADVYDPEVIVTKAPSGGGWERVERRGHRKDLHPDLALLLSTSGTTGAPKLVRLSHENLESNAASIATYLGLASDDRAMSSLPLAYCYGLSVLHSHLGVGASVVLSDRSVVDEGFWQTFRSEGATSFAGVPHTFDLLDRVGFPDLHLPTLRRVTQAGGRLDPATVQRYASQGRRQGWDLFVMYGQTEATARMAYLPPELAEQHPGAIGVAIPGGSLRVDDPDGSGVGELVYRGPNVMMGYAEGPDELALGRTIDELRTGDLARSSEAGLFEIVGRRARFVKPFGLRVDLDQVERVLERRGLPALAAGDDRHVVVATTAAGVGEAQRVVQEWTGLPASAVAVHGVPALPRLANGKPDHAAVLAMPATSTPERPDTSPVRRVFAESLARQTIDGHDTFVSLGGDSMSYVELSVRLEEVVGPLPEDWPVTTVADLERLAERRRDSAGRGARTATVETTVVLRAAAITLVVATHAALVDLKGGAHLLLAVAGWNFARFQLPVDARRLAAGVGRVALPTMAWVAFLLVVSDGYDWRNLALVHTQLGEAVWDERWRFWFIETLVQALALVGIVTATAPLRRLERRRPFAFALAALGAALVLRVASAHDGTVRRPQEVLWFFVLGWTVHRARTLPQRFIVTGVTVATVHGFFGQPTRELIVMVGILALVWVRAVPVVRPLHRATAALASASLAIYLTHWHVYPAVRDRWSPAFAVVASLAVGLGAQAAARRVSSAVRRST